MSGNRILIPQPQHQQQVNPMAKSFIHNITKNNTQYSYIYTPPEKLQKRQPTPISRQNHKQRTKHLPQQTKRNIHLHTPKRLQPTHTHDKRMKNKQTETPQTTHTTTK
jgi:hypothetical protein